MNKTHHIVFGGNMDGIMAAAIYLHNQVQSLDMYRLYPAFSFIRDNKFPNMVKSINLNKEKDILIITDCENHPECDLWVDHHFNDIMGNEPVINSKMSYNPNAKSSTRLMQNIKSEKASPKYSKAFIDTVEMIDGSEFESTKFIFTDTHPLMVLRAYLERSFTSDMIYGRVVEMMCNTHFNIKKAIYQLKIGIDCVNELRKEAESIQKEMLIIGDLSIVRQRKPNKFPRYSEFYVRPETRYSLRLTLINSERYHIQMGFNKWHNQSNEINIGSILSRIPYLIKGGGHYGVGGGIIEEKYIDNLLDDLSQIFYRKENFMEEEMEKTGVDKINDPIESKAEEMVKSGEAKSIHDGREKASQLKGKDQNGKKGI